MFIFAMQKGLRAMKRICHWLCILRHLVDPLDVQVLSWFVEADFFLSSQMGGKWNFNLNMNMKSNSSNTQTFLSSHLLDHHDGVIPAMDPAIHSRTWNMERNSC